MSDYEKLREYTQRCEAYISQLEAELARVRDANHKQWLRSIQLENDVMNDKVQLDFVAHDYQKKIDELKKQAERLSRCVEQAFMAGQIDAGVDPSHSGAQEYTNKQGEGKW